MGDLDDAKRLSEVFATTLEIARDTPEGKEAARSIGRSVVTLAKAVENALLPIAVANFVLEKGKHYLKNSFSKDLEIATRDIPPECLVEPKLSIAGPAIQGLAFSHEEEPLRKMYLNLLASSMNAERQLETHPAFAEVIRQLGARDAKILKDLASGDISHPLISVTIKTSDPLGKLIWQRHILPYNFIDDSGEIYARSGDRDVPTILDNLRRLGLVEIDYSTFLTKPGSYDWVDSNPVYMHCVRQEMPAGNSPDYDRGYLRLTDFGRSFVVAVLGPGALLKDLNSRDVV